MTANCRIAVDVTGGRAGERNQTARLVCFTARSVADIWEANSATSDSVRFRDASA